MIKRGEMIKKIEEVIWMKKEEIMDYEEGRIEDKGFER